MKVILVAVILCVGFSLILGRPDESEPNVAEPDADEETEQQIEESDEDTSSVKTKRGILHYGNDYAHAYGHAHAHVAHAHAYDHHGHAAHGHLHTAVLQPATIPVGLHRPQLLTPYARFPGIHRSVHSPTGHVALTHGGASVQSYSVNYPRVPLVAARPVYPHHHHVAVSRPAIVPVQPAPSVIYQQRPIIPVAVSTSSFHQTNRVPYYYVRPHVAVARPVAPLPLVPTASIPHVHSVHSHVHPGFATPSIYHQIPHVHQQVPHVHIARPVASIPFAPTPVNPHYHQVHPGVATPSIIHQIPHVHQQIPHVHQQIPHVHQQVPHIHQTVPTPLQPFPTQLQPIHPQFLPLPFPTNPTPEALPQPGTTVLSHPGGWRPIVVTSPLPTVPTTATTAGNNPTLGLLPPFFPSESTPEVQPAGAGEAPVQIPQPQTPSTLYLSPAEVNQLDNSNNANYQEYSSAAQELAQSHGSIFHTYFDQQ